MLKGKAVNALLVLVHLFITATFAKEFPDVNKLISQVDSITNISNNDSILELYYNRARYSSTTKHGKDSIAKTGYLFTEIRVAENTKGILDSIFILVEASKNEIENERTRIIKTNIYKRLLGKRITMLLPPKPSFKGSELSNATFYAGKYLYNYSTISSSYGVNTSKCKKIIIDRSNHASSQNKCFENAINFRVSIASVTEYESITGLLNFKFGFPKRDLAIGFNMSDPIIISGTVQAIEYNNNGIGIGDGSSSGFIQDYENIYIDVDSITPYTIK